MKYYKFDKEMNIVNLTKYDEVALGIHDQQSGKKDNTDIVFQFTCDKQTPQTKAAYRQSINALIKHAAKQ